MQQNLESLVAGGHRKVACETLAGEHGDPPEYPDNDIPDSTLVEVPADFPPESFWLSKDSEFDWFDRNAFLQRNESTKGNSNSMNLNPNYSISNNSNPNSQRYSVNLKSKKSAIIGLPKTQKTTYIVDSKRRQCNNKKPANVRLFPKRSDSLGRAPATVPVTEPTSPKVTCIGRVRSKRCCSRRRSSSAQVSQPEKSASQRSGTSRGQKSKTGFMSRITSLFRSDGSRRRKNRKPSEKVKEPAEVEEDCGPRRICVTVKPVINSEPGTPSGPPALGGIIRFASGRRSESWACSDDDVAGRHSLDSARRGA